MPELNTAFSAHSRTLGHVRTCAAYQGEAPRNRALASSPYDLAHHLVPNARCLELLPGAHPCGPCWLFEGPDGELLIVADTGRRLRAWAAEVVSRDVPRFVSDAGLR